MQNAENSELLNKINASEEKEKVKEVKEDVVVNIVKMDIDAIDELGLKFTHKTLAATPIKKEPIRPLKKLDVFKKLGI